MKKIIQGTAGSNREDETLGGLLRVSAQYGQILQELGQNLNHSHHRSPQAFLFDTLHSVKQLNSCMRQEIKQYTQLTSPQLTLFLEKKQLGNSSNLIGKYESLKNEISLYQQRIQELQSTKSEENVYEKLAKEEAALEEEAKKLAARRVNLRNKKEMIEYQIECGQNDLNSLKAQNCQSEIKLRRIQSSLKTKTKK